MYPGQEAPRSTVYYIMQPQPPQNVFVFTNTDQRQPQTALGKRPRQVVEEEESQVEPLRVVRPRPSSFSLWRAIFNAVRWLIIYTSPGACKKRRAQQDRQP
jgi:hypothetical protein